MNNQNQTIMEKQTVNTKYFKALQGFAKKKKLNHLKMPRIRKRKLAAQYAFAIMAKHLREGIPSRSMFEDYIIDMDARVAIEIAAQGH